MAAPNQLWSSIAKDTNYTGGSRTFSTEASQSQPKPKPFTNRTNNTPDTHHKRTTSPSHIPKTPQQEPVYVLTLLTDEAHQKRMTALRKKYFPPKLNKLGAHLTLFHALPESKLESTIVPTIKRVAAEWQPFSVNAAKPFRMKKGIAISVPKNQGGDLAQKVHGALLGAWEGEWWLSEQDAGGMRAHYTIMNKVDDEGEVTDAMEEVTGSWKGDRGTVVGLGLWRYEKGYWKWVEAFEFGRVESEQ
ncbi:hypothetical protein Q7P35_010915 [Cladosporium inversicolor]